jgi:hypothetical protein
LGHGPGMRRSTFYVLLLGDGILPLVEEWGMCQKRISNQKYVAFEDWPLMSITPTATW